ncbi:peptide ABC transporter ATP-binding protein [Clostridium sp. DMHC 10]|uniref:ABC transporter ATP-binding protein n=1 Tax=Clostridium sp. DMHC 10 TaxID=747377 RepID=UPI00069E1970|nr:ABC transporter ATP-binding protein [Clostridium sp. DMHC 10]KOF57606.1 peptide ABC transporter ATP-binding protein [Clostridium sp. DMHC 10]
MPETLLSVKELSINVKNGNERNTAVSGVSFDIENGEILGIVGESGCGKSLTALGIAGLLPKGAAVNNGSIVFDGRELKNISQDEFRKIQGKDITMIFQEPMTSLNPLMTVGKQVAEGLKIHYKLTDREIKERVLKVLNEVGLDRVEELYNSYPHQLSGGMRQRVMIAMAVICRPKLIIADEPTTALDVTTQAKILKLLKDINMQYKTSILFISHDLGVISKLCNRVAVMYAGSFVEEGSTESIFYNPIHQYTRGLIESIPIRKNKGKRLVSIPGKVPSIKERKCGCSFAPRCQKAEQKCFYKKPKSIIFESTHRVCCNLAVGEGEECVI